jgi:hypothetical protein
MVGGLLNRPKQLVSGTFGDYKPTRDTRNLMPEFIFTHRFPDNFKGSPETAAAARAWFQQLGDRVVGRSDPAFETRKLGNCEVDSRPSAYTIVSADNADAAVAMAGLWPLLERGGAVEVRQITTREIDQTVRPWADIGPSMMDSIVSCGSGQTKASRLYTSTITRL